MTLSTNTRPRLRRLLVPVLVAATIVVPVAAAGNGPAVKGENYYARGLPAQALDSTDNGPAVKGENYYARGLPAQALDSTDNGPAVKGENYYARGLPAQIPQPTASISIPTSTAFQWSDAAVGAGSSLVVVGLAIGGYFVLRRRHLQVGVT